ncbi:MAG: glucosyltransferase domain-containing protein [Oscillospiraceae bacterium]|nr:glucosyltransferase domain-containing protein [Oscillospiraceae bacterium]
MNEKSPDHFDIQRSKKMLYTGVYINNIIVVFKRNRKLILLCLIATFMWGLAAHAYIFLHSSFSHDSLDEFNAAVFGNEWRIQLGRVFVPAYRILVRGITTLPWLIGLISLLYINVAVFLVIKIFDIHSKFLTVLIAGIFTANITVIATAATYIHDLDCNMLALLLSVFAVYLWGKYDKGFLYGMIPVCLSMGFYQSFVSVTITLILLYLIMHLLNGERFQAAIKKCIKSIGMIIGGGVLYFFAMKIVCFVTSVSLISGNYNSIDTILSMQIPEMIRTAVYGYLYTCYQILTATSVYSEPVVFGIHIAMIAIAGIIILLRIVQKEIHIKEKIFTLILIASLPIGMNVVYTLTGGMSHDLMYYAIWLVYLFVLLIAWWTVNHFDTMKPIIKSGQRIVITVLVLIILWGNVQTANAAYLKKDLEQDANLSLFTRIVYRMESCDGYVTGETPVVFVGKPDSLLDGIPGFERIYTLTGSTSSYVLGAAGRRYYQAYFDYVLLNPAIIADSETWLQMQTDDEVAAMPCYPEEGSVAIIDGVIVVKLGE